MVKPITPQQANDLLSRGEVDVIDVREPAEWCEGHIPGARLAPLNQLRANAKSTLTRDGVVFVCAAGVRSQAAARIAEAQGLANVYNLVGGTRAWVKAGLGLVNDLSVAV